MEFCSFGPFCHTAMLLKNKKVKHCSYPFDWVFSSPDMIKRCISDNFSTFMNKSRYIHRLRNKCGHLDYHPNMFNHKNPLKNEKDYAYYERCVGRFQGLLKMENKKCFVMMFKNGSAMDRSHIMDWNRWFSTCVQNYHLLIINHYVGIKPFYNTDTIENVTFVNLYTRSESNGVHFISQEDNAFLLTVMDNVFVTL